MSSIKADHKTGQQSAHQGRQGSVAGSEKKMGVIGHESLSVAGDPAFGQKKRKTLDQIVAIRNCLQPSKRYKENSNSIIINIETTYRSLPPLFCNTKCYQLHYLLGRLKFRSIGCNDSPICSPVARPWNNKKVFPLLEPIS